MKLHPVEEQGRLCDVKSIPTKDSNETAAAPSAKAKAPTWQKVKSVEGLYLHTPSGTFYTRYRMKGVDGRKGKRTFRSLETDVLTIAKLRHKEKVAEVEKDRQRGAEISTEFRTLGECAAEVLRRVNESRRAAGSKGQYEDRVLRLRENWQRGAFETFPARNVSHDVLFELREFLSTKARVRMARRWRDKETVRDKRGFSDNVVNQTMWTLRQMLEVAVEKRVMIENPFCTTGVLRESVMLSAKSAVKELPTRADVERVLAEMRRVPDLETYDPGRQQFFLNCANAAADHAEFLAMTGARLQEANASLIEDDKGKTLFIRGTKSESSERYIPVHPALRRLLDRLKGGRTSGRFLQASHSLGPLGRACARLKVGRLTHHHMRHYYATVCIESGVDIPTISRFLGHSDGGILAGKTYGHLRDEHSQRMGERIDFSAIDFSAASAKPGDNVVAFKPGTQVTGNPGSNAQEKTA